MERKTEDGVTHRQMFLISSSVLWRVAPLGFKTLLIQHQTEEDPIGDTQ